MQQKNVRDEDDVIKKESESKASFNGLSLGFDRVHGENLSTRSAQLQRCVRWVRPEESGKLSYGAIGPRYYP